jgi:hypothetical protein
MKQERIIGREAGGGSDDDARTRERRREPRRSLRGRPLGPLWIVGRRFSVGGTAQVVDASAHGLRILVDRRHAWRLARSLREALERRSVVEIPYVPEEGRRRARVIWENPQGYFGLALTEPLGKLGSGERA